MLVAFTLRYIYLIRHTMIVYRLAMLDIFFQLIHIRIYALVSCYFINGCFESERLILLRSLSLALLTDCEIRIRSSKTNKLPLMLSTKEDIRTHIDTARESPKFKPRRHLPSESNYEKHDWCI